jgi:glutaredoxin
MSEHGLTVYYSSVPSTLKLKADQTALCNLLTARNFPFRLVDVSQDAAELAEMRKKSGNNRLPQVFIGDRFFGTWETCCELNEDGMLDRALAAELWH